ncbi:DUF551 domain-containing protein [Raoultella ornithinolytica]|uniref:DUF551 domain-containing protein n=1 Tax=Raoultella ornithinolytica TaxID=54291 RepID=UPI001A23E4C9|nr:DUF551 domain-containing protein [Raoultella ornithinolytica]MCZ0876439.1 DUF551 domain-containing protein [Raoultella ornithinolytica]HAT3644147.1 DUF551 domain-containing protein [Raoultella ornithinolytica]
MTSKLTRERIELIANFHRAMTLPPSHAEIEELARMVLDAMDSKPVAWMHSNNNIGIPAITVSQKIGHYWMAEFENVQPLYRHAQQPVVMDNRAITQYFDTIALETAREILCDVNRRHEFLGGEVQLLSRIQCRIDAACRAAMLQACNSPVIPEWYVMVPKEPTQAMCAAFNDSDYGRKSLRERYVAMLAAAAHDTPALNSVQSVATVPGKWVPVSERMPETDGNYWGWWSESKRQGPVWFIKSELQAQFQSHEITHWMPLPADPQEVNHG